MHSVTFFCSLLHPFNLVCGCRVKAVKRTGQRSFWRAGWFTPFFLNKGNTLDDMFSVCGTNAKFKSKRSQSFYQWLDSANCFSPWSFDAHNFSERALFSIMDQPRNLLQVEFWIDKCSHDIPDYLWRRIKLQVVETTVTSFGISQHYTAGALGVNSRI